MLSGGFGTVLHGMPDGTHAILVYDSLENKHDVLFSHLEEGIGKEGLVYVCSEETKREIRKGLERRGVDVKRLEGNGTLALKNHDEVYIVDGEVNVPKIVAGFEDLAWRYNRKGFKGIRAAGEMSCFLRERKITELVEYERALHTNVAFPAKGICAYNLPELVNTGNLDALWPLLKAHGLVIMTGPHGCFVLPSERVKRADIANALA